MASSDQDLELLDTTLAQWEERRRLKPEFTAKERGQYAAFQKRLEYVLESYCFWRTMFDERKSGKLSIKQIASAQVKARDFRRLLSNLHLEVEQAMAFAIEKGSQGSNDTVVSLLNDVEKLEKACESAASSLKRKRGAPNDRVLEHHVGGLMALVEEMHGKRPVASMSKNSLYLPHASKVPGQVVLFAMHAIDPDIEFKTVVNVMNKINKRQGDTPMRFRDFFPLYGKRLVPVKDNPDFIFTSLG